MIMVKPTRDGIAEVITSMTYRELHDLGDELLQMTKDGDVWDLSKNTDWAQLLLIWAEARQDMQREEKLQAQQKKQVAKT